LPGARGRGLRVLRVPVVSGFRVTEETELWQQLLVPGPGMGVREYRGGMEKARTR